MPKWNKRSGERTRKDVFGRLFKNKRYTFSVVARQLFMWGTIMCWTFIIQPPATVGSGKSSQSYNIVMMIFRLSHYALLIRFIKRGHKHFYFACGQLSS
jgi:fucose permease